MKTKALYKFKNANGATVHSLTKPEGEYTERVRIIADEGKLVTKDGVKLYSVIDADSAEGFYEVDRPTEE